MREEYNKSLAGEPLDLESGTDFLVDAASFAEIAVRTINRRLNDISPETKYRFASRFKGSAAI